MGRVGLLGLDPFVVSQVEHLDRELEVVLLDAVEPEARGQLELDVVVVNTEHAGSPQLVAAHPGPPVVVVGEKPDHVQEQGDQEDPDQGPIHLARPINSPDLLEAIDRSRGLSS